MELLLAFILGLLLGGGVVFLIDRRNKKEIEKSFSALSLDALRRNSADFILLANETLSKQTQSGAAELEEKKQLIDKTLAEMRNDLSSVEKLVSDFDKKRDSTFASVSTQLRLAAEQTGKLQETTGRLQAALANTRVRGQWGERMAEDILQLVGFVEKVNYTRQTTQEDTGKRPDYSFILPQNLRVNMDVKFPLDNYMNYLNAVAESDRELYRKKFIDDTRQKIKEIKSRDYINPQKNTVDCALMFIPNEQVYCFLHENDSDIFESALSSKIIICSPVTLFAILCVIRQGVQIFQKEKTASESLALLDTFSKQWESFKKAMDKMGEKLEDAQKEYNSLLTTRTSQLEKPLNKIREIQEQQSLLDAPGTDGETAPPADEGEQPHSELF